MNRLTMQKGLCAMVSTDYCHEHRDCYECSHGRAVFHRLFEYESRGYTPEEIDELALKVATLETIEAMYNGLGSPEHLRDLVQAERDGMLTV